MNHRFAAVLFDCDGTLVDSELLGVEVMAEVASEHGAVFDPEHMLEELRGVRMTECVALIERACGVVLPPEYVPEFRRRTVIAFTDRLQPMDGALELLTSLRVPFCVASSAPREKIELSLGITGLLHHFKDRIFSSYEIDSWKPDPGLFLHAARTMGVAPELCAVVEDSEPGVEAGLAAGMFVFALGDGVKKNYPEERVQRAPTLERLGDMLRFLA